MKIITYNIDGLPESLDLNDLPWIFKPGVDCYFDEDFKGLSDHYPLVAEIKIF